MPEKHFIFINWQIFAGAVVFLFLLYQHIIEKRTGKSLFSVVSAPVTEFVENLVILFKNRGFNRMLMRQISKISGNSFEEEDILQEAYLRTLQNSGKFSDFSDQDNMKKWINVIAKNTALNEIHNNLRYMDNSTMSLREDILSVPSNRTPSDIFQYSELKKDIEVTISQNHPGYIFDLLSGMTYKEIAELHKVSISTVRSRIYQERKALKPIFKRHGLTIN